MENHVSDKPTSLRKLDSTVVLERFDSTASSFAYLRTAPTSPSTHGTDTSDDKSSDVERGSLAAPLAPVGLDVSIRFGRLGLLMAVAVSVLTTFILVFKSGVELDHFDPATTDADAQKRLIDDYNSYTGNVVSAFGRPIEISVALAVHVVLLRVMKAALLRTEISWKTDLFTLAVTAAVGFLITNGLNALNVQPQQPDITPIISAVDLTFAPDVSMSNAASRSTNLTQSFSERSPKNPITNTALRNLVLARVPAKVPVCDKLSRATSAISVPDLVLEYGFPQRDWQSRLLQEALELKQLHVVVNPSNTTANQPIDVDDLPMNASLAADLFLHSIIVTPTYFRWANAADFANATDLKNRYPTSDCPDSAARVFNLTPPATLALDETTRREWFLRESAAAWIRKLNNTEFTARSDIVMEYSHADISPTMRFDALTIEVEMDPMHVAQASTKDNSTRYNDVDLVDQCGPWPMRCLIKNPGLPERLNDTRYDPIAQVQVFGVCVSPNGTEELSFKVVHYDQSDLFTELHCADLSNTSLMVMSIGKRFTSELITQNRTVNASGYSEDKREFHAAVTNLRRIHTFTIAKLAWEPQNLTAEFHAQCSQDSGSCEGLRLPLLPISATKSQPQELIVGVGALPMNLLTPIVYSYDQRFLPLVQLHEPSRKFTGDSLDDTGKPTLAADPLLPHNVGNITWDMQQPPPSSGYCNSGVEDRLQLIFNNHMYIEHGLQTAYTAATFFLLQNGVVKDVIKLNDNKTSLNFQKSTQRVALLASIPMQNAWLTLGGCALLVVGLCSVLVWAWTTSDGTTAKSDPCRGLGHVTTPHVVARVMLDSVHFPPLFLHRCVINATGTDDSGDDKAAPSVEGFVIDGLALQRPPQEEKQETSCARSA